MKTQIHVRLEIAEPELELIVELLEREQNALPVEIHHTDSNDFRDRLHRRQRLVDDLLARLRPPAA
jgi:hypothetical protein